MPELQNCERCGKVYKSNGFFKVCPICYELDECDFRKIKEYLYSHPCAKIYEVVNALDISVRKIKRYLQESRLEIIEKDNHFLFCETCGKSIRSGKYCDECYRELHHDFQVIYTGNYNRQYSNSVNFKSEPRPSKQAASG